MLFILEVIILLAIIASIRNLRADLNNQKQRLDELAGLSAARPQPQQSEAEPAAEPTASQHLPGSIMDNLRHAGEVERKPSPPAEHNTGKSLAFMGALALLFGIGFFLKYAFDHDLISEPMRVILGIVLGILMIMLGQLMSRRQKYRQYSLIVTGGGLGLIYLSLYGAFNYYHLIPQAWALILMIATTAGGFWLALKEKSKALAITAHVGGLITPLLLMTGGTINSILIVYTIIFNIAFWAIYLQKGWEALYVVNWIGTWAITWTWLFNHDGAPLVGRLLGVSALFLLMMLPPLILSIVKKRLVTRASIAVIVINTGLYAAAISWLTTSANWSDPAIGGLFAALAIVHLILGYILRSEHPEDHDAQVALYATGAILLVAVATPLLLSELNEIWLVLTWLIEGLILLSIGFNHASYAARNLGLITLMLGTAYGFLEFGFRYRGSALLLNGSFAALAAATIALFLASFWYRHYQALLKPAEGKIATMLRFIAHALGLFVISREYSQYINGLDNASRATISNLRRFGLSILWALYASGAMLLGMLRKVRVDRQFATALFTLVILKVFIYDSAQLSEIYRIISFISLGVILLTVSFLIYRYKEEIKEFLTES